MPDTTNMPLDQARCQQLDRDDPLAHCRDRFELPEGLIYLDGNSLGAMPSSMSEMMQQTLSSEWSGDLIQSWNKAGWAQLSQTLGDQLGTLVGADQGQIVVCDTTSSNLYKAIRAACDLCPQRNVVLTQRDNFPTDLYIIEGAMTGVERNMKCDTVAQQDIFDALDEQIAVVVLSHINYKSGEILPMREITEAAHRVGALVIWDLCHSAGVIPIELDQWEVDFAVGCTYKYLNSGPGAPAFIYVANRHIEQARQPLTGWWGHADPFAFEDKYRPASDIGRFLCGTQPVLALKGVACGLDSYSGVSIQDVRQKSKSLCDLFVELVRQECHDSGLHLIGPEFSDQRGSQVSYRFAQGYSLMQALIEQGVVGDFRAPDLMRFGFAPLYIRYEDIWKAVQCLKICLQQKIWLQKKYQLQLPVT
jgi:kynureninase